MLERLSPAALDDQVERSGYSAESLLAAFQHGRDTNWLLRASLPYNSFPAGGGGSTISGVGDIDAFLAY